MKNYCYQIEFGILQYRETTRQNNQCLSILAFIDAIHAKSAERLL